MTWIALEVSVDDAERERVGAWLVERTGHAIEERLDGTLVAFAGGAESATEIDSELRRFPGAVSVVHKVVPEENWSVSWRSGLTLRHFGRLTVAPTWLADEPGAGPRVVLDPETAFGSGEHGSTRAALTLLERHVQAGMRVLDLGSGSGILAIAAVKLGAATAAGVEVDEEAVPVAVRNAERNGVDGAVQFIQGDAAVLAPLLGPAAIVLSNILRVVNVALMPEIRLAMAPGGLAIFSGMEASEAQLFLPELQQAGLEPVDEVVDAGWWAVAARQA